MLPVIRHDRVAGLTIYHAAQPTRDQAPAEPDTKARQLPSPAAWPVQTPFPYLYLMNTNPDFDKSGGLVPAIAQDAATGQVLMMAWMNRDAYEETLRTGRAVYFSRSRNKLWRKGEESGNVQEVRGIFVDCDEDTILLKVHQIGGAACHEGYKSCFFRQVEGDGLKVVAERVFDPKAVYKK